MASGDANLLPRSENAEAGENKVFIYSPFEKREERIQWVKTRLNNTHFFSQLISNESFKYREIKHQFFLKVNLEFTSPV